MRKEKTTVKFFSDKIVFGNLVIMRFSVHLCQRKFLNKHLRFSIHVLHASFIPPLVAKSYAPCICHARTFPVLLVMSPVPQFAFSSIQFTHESKYMHGCRYALNGTKLLWTVANV
jgi:hypothetical protein